MICRVCLMALNCLTAWTTTGADRLCYDCWNKENTPLAIGLAGGPLHLAEPPPSPSHSLAPPGGYYVLNWSEWPDDPVPDAVVEVKP